MANVHDVAAHIVTQHGPLTTMKIQKLAYYSQAWHLVWDEKPLFTDPIQAWMNGPVIPALYAAHRGRFTVDSWRGDPGRLTDAERETIDAVLMAYGPMEPRQLSELTHGEQPWREAREGLLPTERGNRIISLDTMQQYYAGLA